MSYRFLWSPKWVAFHLLVVIGIITMINLGFWQLRRLEARQDFNATVQARYDAEPVPLDNLLSPDTQLAESEQLTAVEWRPVTVTGQYLPDSTEIRIVNRFQNGRAGDNLVVPLLLDDGEVLLVNRGFVPQGIEDLPGLPAGQVEITGRLRTSEVRRLGQLSDAAEGPLAFAQRIDIERFTDQFEPSLRPMYIELIESQPSSRSNGLPAPITQPDLSEGNHLSYAVQWFIFSVAVAVGWVLAVRWSIRNRQQAAMQRPRDDTGVVADREHHVSGHAG